MSRCIIWWIKTRTYLSKMVTKLDKPNLVRWITRWWIGLWTADLINQWMLNTKTKISRMPTSNATSITTPTINYLIKKMVPWINSMQMLSLMLITQHYFSSLIKIIYITASWEQQTSRFINPNLTICLQYVRFRIVRKCKWWKCHVTSKFCGKKALVIL